MKQKSFKFYIKANKSQEKLNSVTICLLKSTEKMIKNNRKANKLIVK